MADFILLLPLSLDPLPALGLPALRGWFASGLERSLTRDELVEVEVLPVTDVLLVSDSLEFCHLLFCIGLNEFFNNHVSSSNSDHKLAVDDLGVDLLGPKQIETITESLDRNRTLSVHQEVSKELIDGISLLSLILGCGLTQLCLKIIDMSLLGQENVIKLS